MLDNSDSRWSTIVTATSARNWPCLFPPENNRFEHQHILLLHYAAKILLSGSMLVGSLTSFFISLLHFRISVIHPHTLAKADSQSMWTAQSVSNYSSENFTLVISSDALQYFCTCRVCFITVAQAYWIKHLQLLIDCWGHLRRKKDTLFLTWYVFLNGK